MSIAKELARLERLTATQLRQRHLEVFGEPSRSGNRAYLFHKVAWRLQANAMGDLSERARRRAAELANDANLRSRAPRNGVPALRLAPAPTGAAERTKMLPLPRPIDRRLPGKGTILTREYRGRTYTVEILPDGGLVFDGEAYRSLTAVAKRITGSHWNGYLFFGLKPGKRERASS